MIHSFLLIGQSNMAGRGALTEAASVERANLRVLRNGLWTGFFRPVNPDRAFSGVSLAESFADAYAKKYGVKVGLIPCADGGTSLDQWKEGSILYDNAVFQARLAARSSTVAGILWHQGESDCAPELYSTYRERFEKMIAAMRRDTGLYDVPVIVGGLGDFLSDCKHSDLLVNYGHVNDALKSVAENDKNVGFASAEGLGANPDNLHFNAAALHEFGLRYFEKYEEICDREKLFTNTSSEESTSRSAMELL